MAGPEVVTNDVTRAAAKIQVAGNAVKGADPSGDLSPISAALPGSQSAGAVSALTTAWRKQFARWGTEATTQHDEMVASARTYDEADGVTQGRMKSTENRVGGRTY